MLKIKAFTKNADYVYTEKVPNGTRDWRPAKVSGNNRRKAFFYGG